MLAVALSFLGLAIFTLIAVTVYSIYQKHISKKEKVNLIDTYLHKAPKLCTWTSHELDNNRVQFNLHSFGMLDGAGIFGSFILDKNKPLAHIRKTLKEESRLIVEEYNNKFLISNNDWNGPHQLGC